MLREFVKWIKDTKKLNEGVFGNWNYVVPDDKEQQLYDFYMIEYLLPPGIQMYLKQVDFGGYDVEKEREEENKYRVSQGLPPVDAAIGDMARPHEEKFSYSLYEAANKLLPQLRKELLQAVEFAVAAELRHLLNANRSVADNSKQVILDVKNKLGPEYADLLKKYLMNMIGHGSSIGKGIIQADREPLHPDLKTNNEQYKDSYRVMKAVGGTPEQWAKLAAWVFRNTEWSHAYGGEAWAQIAEGWLRLQKSPHGGPMIAAIDHIYDLEHNTGSVFTKMEKYAKGGSYKWVTKALDHKRYLVNPYEMMEHISPSMRELAMLGIKLKTGQTWPEFEEKWPEIVKQKTDIYNQVRKHLYDKDKDAYRKKYGYGSPNPVSPEEFERLEIHSSSNPWSVYHLTKQGKEEAKAHVKPIDDTGATKKIPDFSEIQVGDQFSQYWPPSLWNTVIRKEKGTGKHHPTYGEDRDKLFYMSDGREYWLDLNYVKAYRTKADAAKAALKPVAPVAAPVAAPSVVLPGIGHKDGYGKDIKIGDTVQKIVSMTGKSGTVADLMSGGMVTVQWPSYQKNYFSTALKVTASQPAAPQQVPAAPPAVTPTSGAYTSPFKIGDKVVVAMASPESHADSTNWLTVVGIEGNKIKAKNYFGTINLYSWDALKAAPTGAAPPKPKLGTPVPFEPTAPLAPAAKPVWTPPSPEEKKEQTAAKAKKIFDGLPKIAKNLKYARTIRGLGSYSSIEKAVDELQAALNIALSFADRDAIKNAYKEESAMQTYYDSRGHLKFPKHLNSEQAWKQMLKNFPNAPHVFLDSDVDYAIETALAKHDNSAAVQTIHKATQFNSDASIALAILKKLELYQESKIKD